MGSCRPDRVKVPICTIRQARVPEVDSAIRAQAQAAQSLCAITQNQPRPRTEASLRLVRSLLRRAKAKAVSLAGLNHLETRWYRLGLYIGDLNAK